MAEQLPLFTKSHDRRTAAALYHAAARGTEVVISAKAVTRGGQVTTTIAMATPEGVVVRTSTTPAH